MEIFYAWQRNVLFCFVLFFLDALPWVIRSRVFPAEQTEESEMEHSAEQTKQAAQCKQQKFFFMRIK